MSRMPFDVRAQHERLCTYSSVQLRLCIRKLKVALVFKFCFVGSVLDDAFTHSSTPRMYRFPLPNIPAEVLN